MYQSYSTLYTTIVNVAYYIYRRILFYDVLWYNILRCIVACALIGIAWPRVAVVAAQIAEITMQRKDLGNAL